MKFTIPDFPDNFAAKLSSKKSSSSNCSILSFCKRSASYSSSFAISSSASASSAL